MQLTQFWLVLGSKLKLMGLALLCQGSFTEDIGGMQLCPRVCNHVEMTFGGVDRSQHKLRGFQQSPQQPILANGEARFTEVNVQTSASAALFFLGILAGCGS